VVLVSSYRLELSAPCGVEAKVSIVRMGPKGTSAEDAPGSFGITIAVTLAATRFDLRARWAASGYSLSAVPGLREPNGLLRPPKKVR
jgi:hypothetical protein